VHGLDERVGRDDRQLAPQRLDDRRIVADADWNPRRRRSGARAQAFDETVFAD